MKAIKIVLGEYDDKLYFIVRGAESVEEARQQVQQHLRKKWPNSTWFENEDYTAEEITIKRGVTEL